MDGFMFIVCIPSIRSYIHTYIHSVIHSFYLFVDFCVFPNRESSNGTDNLKLYILHFHC